MADLPPADPSPRPTDDAPQGPLGTQTDPLAHATAGGQPALAEPTPAAPARRAAPYWFLGVVTAVSLALDLVSKAWAMGAFEGARKSEPHQIVVIEGFMSLIYAKNKGGAWGLLQNENESLRRPFFLIVSVVAIVFIVSLYRKLAPGQTALKWGLPLVLGGALGNLIDRIRYGYVVDFIDMFVKWGGEVRHWPTYNVADIAICVGVGLMAIDMFTPRRKHKIPAVVAASSAEPGSHDVLGSLPRGATGLVAADLAGGTATLEPVDASAAKPTEGDRSDGLSVKTDLWGGGAT
jgi:signal peptidase II